MANASRGRVRTGSQDKPWRDALSLCINEKDAKGVRKLRRIAEKTVELAIAGDMEAVKEIGNRMDGKPTETVAGDKDRPLTMEFVWAAAKAAP